MKLEVLKGATSQIWDIFIQDSSSTTGAGLTGLVFNSAGLTCYFARSDQGNAGGTQITLATATRGTFASSGFVEKDATNMPGVYEFHPTNASVASGANAVVYLLKGATNMAPLPIEVQLTSYDPNDAVRLGLSSLPNAAAEAAGGLYTRGSGAGQINQANNGNVDVNAVRLGGTVLTARDIGASVLLSSGAGAGQLDFTAGVVKANLAQILGTALTETAGQLAAAFKKFFDKAAPTGTINSIPDAVAGAANGLFIAGTNAATTANIAGNLTGNVTGSVGSVTGAVGSVTGNVGGNVVGSTASVTGAVGSVTTVTSIVNGVWDEPIAGHLTAGSTGNKLNAASSAGDPWATALPGAYTAGQAGKIVGDKLPPLTFTVANQIDSNVITKTGFSLASTGLDAVAAPTDLTNDANARSSFVKMFRAIFNRLYDEVTQTATQQKVRNDSGTVISTMPVSDDGVTQTKGLSV